MLLKPNDVSEIEERLLRVTEWPWEVGYGDGSGMVEYLPADGGPVSSGAYISADQDRNTVVMGGNQEGCPVGVLSEADAVFIAQAPQDIANLIQTLKKGWADIYARRKRPHGGAKNAGGKKGAKT